MRRSKRHEVSPHGPVWDKSKKQESSDTKLARMGIKYPESRIKYPESSIQNQESSIQRHEVHTDLLRFISPYGYPVSETTNIQHNINQL